MNPQEAFRQLLSFYGTHKAAALALGYTPEHYRGLRNGRFPISERVKKAICTRAAELRKKSTSE